MESLEGELQENRDEIEFLRRQNMAGKALRDWEENEMMRAPDIVRTAELSTADIQRALKITGHYDGSIDGKMGPKTKAAIKGFQADNGLKVDGIVGPQTTSFLRRYLSE